MAESYDIHLTDPLSPAFKVRAFTSNGPIFPTSSDPADTASSVSTSLLVYGRGHSNYGERIAENILHIMENFSGSTAPTFPTSGQLWFARYTLLSVAGNYYEWVDDDANINGGGWVPFIPIPSAAPPDPVVNGGYWINTGDNVLSYGINDTSHPLNGAAGTWLSRIYDTLLSLPDLLTHKPRKTLKVFDGVDWVNTSTVYVAEIDGEPPTPVDGDLWIDTTTGRLKFYVNGTFEETVAQTDLTGILAPYLLLDGTTPMTGSLNLNNIARVVNSLDPITNQDLTTKIYVDTEITTAIAAIPSAPVNLFNLGDVNAATVPTTGNFLKGDGSIWSNSSILLGDLADITSTSVQVNFLGGGNPVTSSVQLQLDTKISTTGGTMTGVLTLSADPIINLDAATKQYVDNEIASVGGGGASDGVLNVVTFSSGTMDLQFDTTIPSTINVDMSHQHSSIDVQHLTTQPLLRDLEPAYPNIPLDVILEALLSNFNSRLASIESPGRREVVTATAAQTNFNFTEFEYTVGANRLSVFVDGIKQYVDERAEQDILFLSFKNLSASAPHGLADGTYDLDIAADGGAATTINLVVTNGTGTNLTIQSLIDLMNTVPGTTSVWSKSEFNIQTYSNTTGVGSEVNIVDGAVNGILAAMVVVSATIELPVINVGAISPAAAGPITQITQNLDYKETDDLFAEEAFGAKSVTLVFAAGLVGGEKVEITSEPEFLEMV